MTTTPGPWTTSYFQVRAPGVRAPLADVWTKHVGSDQAEANARLMAAAPALLAACQAALEYLEAPDLDDVERSYLELIKQLRDAIAQTARREA